MVSKLREPVSGLMHLGGAIAALVGQIVLLVMGWPGVEKIAAVLVYGLSLIGLFSASATYHLVNAGPKVTAALRKLDHAAIYLLIAGSYTPFCLLAFEGFFRWGMLAIVWTFAIVGIIIKLFYMGAPRWVSALIYLLMGWLCLLAAGEMFTALPTISLVWMIVGGVIYSLGAVVYATKIFDFLPGKFGFHEVWHIFVLLGAAAHFIAVLGVVATV
jgi:hemolysin III